MEKKGNRIIYLASVYETKEVLVHYKYFLSTVKLNGNEDVSASGYRDDYEDAICTICIYNAKRRI